MRTYTSPSCSIRRRWMLKRRTLVCLFYEKMGAEGSAAWRMLGFRNFPECGENKSDNSSLMK